MFVIRPAATINRALPSRSNASKTESHSHTKYSGANIYIIWYLDKIGLFQRRYRARPTWLLAYHGFRLLTNHHKDFPFRFYQRKLSVRRQKGEVKEYGREQNWQKGKYSTNN